MICNINPINSNSWSNQVIQQVFWYWHYLQVRILTLQYQREYQTDDSELSNSICCNKFLVTRKGKVDSVRLSPAVNLGSSPVNATIELLRNSLIYHHFIEKPSSSNAPQANHHFAKYSHYKSTSVNNGRSLSRLADVDFIVSSPAILTVKEN